MAQQQDVKESWWKGNSAKIYTSHLLSSWGDRMWSFAVGLYLVILYPTSLQLTAAYGLSLCVSVIICGPVLGKWIDKTKRITVAQVALIVQNSSVVICSILLILLLYYKTPLENRWDGVGKTLLLTAVIILAVIGNLGSEATKIALQKDWVVVLSGGSEAKLAKMNATMRSIDLTTFILAPILVGQIITFASQLAGASFIGGWNIFSVFCEYFLLTDIYKRVPELANKSIPLIQIDSPVDCPQREAPQHTNPELTLEEHPEVPPFRNKVHPENSLRLKKVKSCWMKMWSGLMKRISESGTGWKDYFAHPVRGAGIGLALLYMTVLGFDSITTGYAYSQGMSESLLGIATAVGAVFGILGSVSFPFLRKTLGKCVTGILGFGLETGCLVLCLVSIVAPGSPFVHKFSLWNDSSNDNSTLPPSSGDETPQSLSPAELWNTRISVVLLMTGIVLSRFGLWVADLSVVQIFQEEIPADSRGVLNGVQGSLNQGMNLLKFIIVIILPNPNTFAYLIVVSWIFVFSGWVSFIIFSWNFRRRVSATSVGNADNLRSGLSVPDPEIPKNTAAAQDETSENNN